MSFSLPGWDTRAPTSASKATLDPRIVAIWLAASLIAVFFALVDSNATVIDGTYLPRGNDSMYHARRILDAALGSRGFYQFDDRIQVPDGAWIPWPWAYDYLLAQALKVALWIAPTLDPVGFLCYAPVAWIFVNAALFLAATGAIGLSTEMRAIAMFGFAFSPLTQLLHNVGMVDHHYVEHTFVLLTIWLGARWLKDSASVPRAVGLAVALGVAPSFHSGLFILQLVPLTTVFVLWLRGAEPPPRSLRAFAVALLVSTQLILLPSTPYRSGMFEFGLLSWFHFYVAFCTAAAFAFMSYRPLTTRTLGAFTALCALLVAPLGAQIMSGAGFVSAKFSILQNITEAQSPYHMLTSFFGPIATLSYYSCLLILVPVLLAFYAYRAFRLRRPEEVYYAVFVALGLALFMQQFRFYYFGLFSMITGALIVIDRVRSRRGWHRGVVFAATFAAIVLAYQPPLRGRLFTVYAPGADVDYASALSIFFDLHDLCATDPGVVFANPDDGNAILFHSDCSVIANQFILRPEDEKHINEIYRLMQLTPEQLTQARPDVKYLFIRVRDYSILQGDRAYIIESNPIAKQLLIDDTPPPGFKLVKTVKRRIGVDGVAGVYARLYEVEPVAGAAPR